MMCASCIPRREDWASLDRRMLRPMGRGGVVARWYEWVQVGGRVVLARELLEGVL